MILLRQPGLRGLSKICSHDLSGYDQSKRIGTDGSRDDSNTSERNLISGNIQQNVRISDAGSARSTR